MAFWNGPDPYTYEKIGKWPTGRPVYVVSFDGVELGVIVPVRVNTDRKIGRGLRHVGKGRDGFSASGDFFAYDTRRQVADWFRDRPMTAAAIAAERRRFQ